MSEEIIKALMDKGLTMEFIESFQRNLLKEESEQETIRQELKKSALEKANNISILLKSKYRASKVYLFGSLAADIFDEYSDIDLYVVGFTGDYWRALIDSEEIALPFKFDLVCEESAVKSLQEKVYKGGVLL